MNEQAASLAALNVSLLEAIKAGPPPGVATGPTELAGRAGVDQKHVNRKLGSLLEAGLILKTGEGSCDVALTDDGERGLAAMAVWRGDVSAAALNAEGVVYLRFDLIDAWDGNPRTVFDQDGLDELEQSIADKGVLQPITVRRKADGRFEVIMGERRRRSSTQAVANGRVAADFLIPCMIRDYTDDDALDVAGIENLQRDDLHWMDEAQYYWRLSQRGRTARQIDAITGARRSKRHVQTYVQIARDLSPEDVARCYLPEGHKDRILYTQARDMVGEKKEKPALALSPKLACAFLEAIHAGMILGGFGGNDGLPKVGTKISTRFYKPPVGGSFATLQHDRQLMTFGFQDFGKGREVAGVVTITEDVVKWLRQVGYADDRATALRKVRADVVGDMVAAQMHREGRYFSNELNAPEAPAIPELTSGQRRKLVEIAHKMAADNPGDPNACLGTELAVGESALNDPDFNALAERGLIAMQDDSDEVFTVTLTSEGVDYLEAENLLPNGALDCPALDQVYRADSRGEAKFVLTTLKGRYSTSWMNEGPEAAEPSLPPSAMRKLVEIAHKIASKDVTVDRPEDVFNIPTRLSNDASDDEDFRSLEARQLIRVNRQLTNLIVYVDYKGQDLLRTEQLVPTGQPDCPALASVYLADHMPTAKLLLDGGVYASKWMNTDPPAEAADEDEDEDDTVEPVRAPAPTPTQAPPPTPPGPVALPAMLAIVLVELAHAIGHDRAIERTPQDWGAPVLANYHLDGRGSTLVQQYGMLRFLPRGLETLAHLTAAGRDWLTATYEVDFVGDRPVVPFMLLDQVQKELVGAQEPDKLYSTPWLNPPPKVEAPPNPAPPLTPAPSAVSPQTRALVLMDSTIDKAASLLGRLRGNATAGHKTEIDQLVALIANARDAAKPHLPEQG